VHHALNIWTEEIQFDKGATCIHTLFLEFHFDSEIFLEFLRNSLVHSYSKVGFKSNVSKTFEFDSLATAQCATYLINGVKSYAGMLLLTRP